MNAINYKNNCRICGFTLLEPPWGEDGKTPSFDICPCCGVEFGYEDATNNAIQRYRDRWLSNGSPWFRPELKPANWLLKEQLKQIPPDYR